MPEGRKPLIPVKPQSMEVVYFYPCPFCERGVPVVAPTQPTLVRCDACGKQFPIVPVDERTVRFIKIMSAGGRAAVDPDFA